MTGLVTELDIEIMERQGMGTLAEWYCMLNRWQWPDELPNEEEPEDRREGRRTALMKWIKNRVGQRVCSRVWNKDMGDEEFEDFWRGAYEGDKDAKDRHEKRLNERYAIDDASE
jgi:hypothetical protein